MESYDDKDGYDYKDNYSTTEIPPDRFQEITPNMLGRLFFSYEPWFLSVLMKIRHYLALITGLDTFSDMEKERKKIETTQFEIGENIGLFDVMDKTNDELVLGKDDWHLNFRVHLQKQVEDRSVHLITVVKYNTRFGKVYFFIIRPFHMFLVAKMTWFIEQELLKSE